MMSTNPSPCGPADRYLVGVLEALDGAGIALALVRPPGRDGHGRLEADLLVEAHDRGATETHLAGHGFRRRPGWGRRPHRFHLRPVTDGPAARVDWLKIDLVTELRFGRHHQLPAIDATTCLAARSPADVAEHRLAPPDEFAALLLHALLDRDAIRPDQRARLAALAPSARRRGPLADRCAPRGAEHVSWDRPPRRRRPGRLGHAGGDALDAGRAAAPRPEHRSADPAPGQPHHPGDPPRP